MRQVQTTCAQDFRHSVIILNIQGDPKIGTLFVRLIILSHIDHFANFFHCQNE